MGDYFEIGKIINTHGIKGAVKVFPTTEDPKRFELLDNVIVQKNTEHIQMQIKSIQYIKNLIVLKFKGINSINEAEEFKNCNILIKREDALPLEKDEYYISDLYGIQVITDKGELLGKIVDIIYTGSNDVYVVKNKSSEILIPAIKDCIKKIDIKNKIMTVYLMEGLRNT